MSCADNQLLSHQQFQPVCPRLLWLQVVPPPHLDPTWAARWALGCRNPDLLLEARQLGEA